MAMSRARLGLYIFARVSLFRNCYELSPAFNQVNFFMALHGIATKLTSKTSIFTDIALLSVSNRFEYYVDLYIHQI